MLLCACRSKGVVPACIVCALCTSGLRKHVPLTGSVGVARRILSRGANIWMHFRIALLIIDPGDLMWWQNSCPVTRLANGTGRLNCPVTTTELSRFFPLKYWAQAGSEQSLSLIFPLKTSVSKSKGAPEMRTGSFSLSGSVPCTELGRRRSGRSGQSAGSGSVFGQWKWATLCGLTTRTHSLCVLGSCRPSKEEIFSSSASPETSSSDTTS
mmetsp:Transcript_2842/g.7002  ORF Transcript_2842/g.7002 Transcript_2842/m.7002 type:complete len:211 (-) Transcript_2842:34-666(-)